MGCALFLSRIWRTLANETVYLCILKTDMSPEQCNKNYFIWLPPFKRGHMCILTRKDLSIGPPAFFKQTHTYKHSVRWNSWVIGSLCLQCCVLARPVMAPFAVCSNGVNGISSLSTVSPHLARGWVVNAYGFVCWWPTAYPSTGFKGMSDKSLQNYFNSPISKSGDLGFQITQWSMLILSLRSAK